MLMSQLWLTFLDRIGHKEHSLKFDHVNTFVKGMEAKWLQYDREYDVDKIAKADLKTSTPQQLQ